uniref:COX6C domain-containing protein n=1 Tax=Panagrellus redivivus TaxID=6233 RepID=A0A7E4VPT8_PANRE
MVVSKVWEATKWTAETVRGAAVVLASPNAPVPESQLHPRMPARPWTAGEWVRMTSWRHMWKYLPVLRYYVYSGFILYGAYKFLLPIKPHHKVLYSQGKIDAHHHEVEHWYGIRQKVQDKEYFAKYDPLRKPGQVDVSGHH